jgi:O-antigen ligase
MFLARPIFGWGFSNFDRYDREFQGRVGDLVNPEKDHASHNLYLTLLAEQGLTGFFLYVSPIVWCAILSLIALPRMPTGGFWSRKLLLVLWLVVVYFVVINNFFNVIVVYSLGLWWITLALLANLVHDFLSRQSPAPKFVNFRSQGHYHARLRSLLEG